MFKIMRGILVLIGIVLIFMLLTACSTNSSFAKKNNQENINRENMPSNEEYVYNNFNDEPVSGKNNDQRYNLSNNDNYYETGNASWYGREFHGRKTASGEKFDMNKFTAAHKKLPFGTELLVRNLENGKSVSVTINDRGPYRDNRILDLSYAAAKQLGIIAKGEANVGIRIIGKDDITKTDNNYYNDNRNTISTIDPVIGVGVVKEADRDFRNEYNAEPDNMNDTFSIQTGAFYSRKNAERFKERLEGIVNKPVKVYNIDSMYKVRIERISSRNDAVRIKRLLEDEDISSFIIENLE